MSEILSKDDIENIFNLIKDVVNKMENIKGGNKIRVILMGTTGAGKSSLTNGLSANKTLMIIEGPGRRPIVQGEGVFIGNKSGTRDPGIDSSDSELIFCDCPGFEDTEGFLQEIINAFAIDCLFKGNSFKILLVATEGELLNRVKSLVNSIKRLNKIFTNHDQLKSGIGLVVTQGDADMASKDIADIINTEPPEELKDMAAFFNDNQDRIFVFPKPSRKDIGKEYSFDDRDRLISFLKQDPIVNPEHGVALSEKAELIMQNLKKIHEKNSSDKVKAVTDKINNQFIKDNELEEISKWITIMEKIEKCNVKKANEFPQIIKENIPEPEQYNDDMKDLTAFEIFDQFIDKVLPPDDSEPALVKQIQAWAQQSIIQLDSMKKEAERIDNLKVENIKEQVNSIAGKIGAQFRNKKTIEEINKSINQMEQIKSNHIVNNHRDFTKFVNDCFSEFSNDLTILNEYTRKDIDIKDIFDTWFSNTNTELDNMKKEAERIDNLKVDRVIQQINSITGKIGAQFRNKKTTIEEINKSINQMEQIKSNHIINNHRDFTKFVNDCFSEFSNDLTILNEYTRKDIDIKDIFDTWFSNTNTELDNMKKDKEKEENNKKESDLIETLKAENIKKQVDYITFRISSEIGKIETFSE